MKLLQKLFAIALAMVGAGLLVGGIWLATLGGSGYYLVLGIAYVIAGIQLFIGRRSGAVIALLAALLTVPWAVWEGGFNFWPLFPRLVVPFAVAALAMMLAPAAPGMDRSKAAWRIAPAASACWLLSSAWAWPLCRTAP